MEDGDGIELVQRYDSKSGEWTEVAGMLIPRSGSAACLLGGFIYVIGMKILLLFFKIHQFYKSLLLTFTIFDREFRLKVLPSDIYLFLLLGP